MPTSVKKRITVRELREHPERYPHITQAAESFKPLVARFLAAKKEAEQVFENLRGADMDEAVAYCREHPLSPEAVAVLIHVARRAQTLEKAKAAISSKLANDPKQAAMRETLTTPAVSPNRRLPIGTSRASFATRCSLSACGSIIWWSAPASRLRWRRGD